MYAFLADIHLGTKLQKKDYLKSLNDFFKLIKSHKEECHCIFVCGDLFDKRLNPNELNFAGVFLINLVCNNCGRNGTKHVPVHFIHGTYSHDYDQYDIFIPLLQKIDGVNIFYTKDICSKTIDGRKILYLPQLYGDVDYSIPFENKYDIIIGHGPISSETSAPCPAGGNEIMLPVETLNDISNICIFGHYHQYTDFGNHVFYAGSMLRWMYGEDETKYFIFVNDNYEIEKHVNDIAIKYDTVYINTPDELRDRISDNIKNPTRFIIYLDNENDLSFYHAIMNTNKRNDLLSFKIINKVNNDNKNDNINDNDKTNVVIEEPIPGLITYIKDKYDIDVSEKIHDYENKIKE